LCVVGYKTKSGKVEKETENNVNNRKKEKKSFKILGYYRSGSSA